MTKLGLRPAARAVSMDHGQLKRLADKGQVTRNSDKTFDLDVLRKELPANLDQAFRRTARSGDKSPPTPQSPVTSHRSNARRLKAAPVRTEADAKDAVALIASVLKAEGVEPGAIDFNAARTADVILKARARDLAIAERRKELVPLVQVKAHIGKAFVSIRQAIERLPSRYGPEMAAALNVDPSILHGVLSKAIVAMLSELSAPVLRS